MAIQFYLIKSISIVTVLTADTITKICEVLDVAPYQLFYFENCREIGSIKDELIDKIKKDDEFATFIYKASLIYK